MASTSKQNEEEIPKCVTLKDFKMGGSIRKVGYAEVFLVRKRGGCDDRKYYAMKRIDTSDNDYKKIEQSVMTEIQVGQKVLGATFFVGLHYVFWSESHVNLVMEYMGGLDMLYLLTKRKNLLERHARFYLAEVLLAIEALHEMGIVHRNINPHNILLDSVGHIGLVNFGSCKRFQPHEEKERNRAFRETLEYMAPEIIKSEGHDMAVDWWSFGILAYDMIVGLTPFERNGGISEDWMYQRILNREPKMYPQFSSEAADLMTRLLDKDPKKRLGCGKEGSLEIKNHPFFNDINWTDIAKKAIRPPYMPVWRRQPRPVEKVDVNTNGDQSGVALPLQPEVTPSQKHDITFKIPQVPKKKRMTLRDSPAPPDGVKPASHSPVVSASTSDCALKTESSIRMSQKRKHNINSEGSTVLPKKHCPTRSSDSKTLLKITQKVDKEGRQLKRRYSYDDKSAQSCEEVQPHRLSTKRRKTM